MQRQHFLILADRLIGLALGAVQVGKFRVGALGFRVERQCLLEFRLGGCVLLVAGIERAEDAVRNDILRGAGKILPGAVDGVGSAVARDEELRPAIERRRRVRIDLQGRGKFFFGGCVFVLGGVGLRGLDVGRSVGWSQRLGCEKLLARRGEVLFGEPDSAQQQVSGGIVGRELDEALCILLRGLQGLVRQRGLGQRLQGLGHIRRNLQALLKLGLRQIVVAMLPVGGGQKIMCRRGPGIVGYHGAQFGNRVFNLAAAVFAAADVARADVARAELARPENDARFLYAGGGVLRTLLQSIVVEAGGLIEAIGCQAGIDGVVLQIYILGKLLHAVLVLG